MSTEVFLHHRDGRGLEIVFGLSKNAIKYIMPFKIFRKYIEIEGYISLLLVTQ